MKRVLRSAIVASFAAVLLVGCVATIGNKEAKGGNVTLGQQLIDLQKAKEAGAINEAEYEAQKAKLLGK